jgi:dsRNA-specific ribonuclease
MTIDPAKPSVMNPLEERILYKFRNGLLLAEALTHPSISLERKNYPFDNQRLEFLGDAVIQVSVTEHLFRMFPDFGEGQLTKLRTRIVSRPALRDRAFALDLGSFIMMGRGEESSGGRERAESSWIGQNERFASLERLAACGERGQRKRDAHCEDLLRNQLRGREGHARGGRQR